MKKFAIIATALAMVLSFSACGKNKNQPTTPSRATQPITVPTKPDMTMPSTNIPDPTVDSNSTMPTGDTGNTNSTTGTAANR